MNTAFVLKNPTIKCDTCGHKEPAKLDYHYLRSMIDKRCPKCRDVMFTRQDFWITWITMCLVRLLNAVVPPCPDDKIAGVLYGTDGSFHKCPCGHSVFAMVLNKGYFCNRCGNELRRS